MCNLSCVNYAKVTEILITYHCSSRNQSNRFARHLFPYIDAADCIVLHWLVVICIHMPIPFFLALQYTSKLHLKCAVSTTADIFSEDKKSPAWLLISEGLATLCHIILNYNVILKVTLYKLIQTPLISRKCMSALLKYITFFIKQ